MAAPGETRGETQGGCDPADRGRPGRPDPARIAAAGRAAAISTILGLASFVLAWSSPGCTPARRYEVLSFFFDGVPEPGAPAAEPTAPVSSQYITSAEPEGAPAIARAPRFTHEPFGKRECTRCHPRDIGLYLGEDFDRRGLCFDCHKEFEARFEGFAYQHGPVAAASCLVCHSPHESMYRGLITAPDPELCLGCHDPSILGSPPHEGRSAPCLPCHDPHGGDRRFFLTKKTAADGSPAAEERLEVPPPSAREDESERR